MLGQANHQFAREMDKPLKPLTVFLALLLFGGLLSGKLWAAQRASAVDHPGHMQVHPDGRLFIQVGERLFALSPGGGDALFDLDDLRVGRTGGGAGAVDTGAAVFPRCYRLTTTIFMNSVGFW